MDTLIITIGVFVAFVGMYVIGYYKGYNCCYDGLVAELRDAGIVVVEGDDR